MMMNIPGDYEKEIKNQKIVCRFGSSSAIGPSFFGDDTNIKLPLMEFLVF